MPRLPLLTILLTALALLAPTAAQAAVEVEYRVDFEAAGEWELDYELRDGKNRFIRGLDAKARYAGTLDGVVFRDGRLVGERIAMPTFEAEGGGLTTDWAWHDQLQQYTIRDGACLGEQDSFAVGLSRLRRDPRPRPGSTGESLELRIAELGYVFFECQVHESFDVDLAIWGPNEYLTWNARFELPSEAIGMGKIIQHISADPNQRSPNHCPGRVNTADVHSQTCKFNWTGKVTFTKVRETADTPPPGEGDGLDVPPPAGGSPLAQAPPGGPAPAGAQQPPPVDEKPPAAGNPRVTGAASLSSNADRLSFFASCPTGCAGRAAISASGAKARAAAVLARVRFTVPAGDRSRVTVKLPRKARAALRRVRRAKVALTLVPRGGGAPAKQTLAIRRRA
jgi:hypothetical protein